MNGTCSCLQSEELGLASQTFGEVLKESQVGGKLDSSSSANSIRAAANKSRGKEQVTTLFRPMTH